MKEGTETLQKIETTESNSPAWFSKGTSTIKKLLNCIGLEGKNASKHYFGSWQQIEQFRLSSLSNGNLRVRETGLLKEEGHHPANLESDTGRTVDST